MNKKDFNKLLEKRIQMTKSTLSSKNKEYASDTDKLHNFKRAGHMLRCTPESALIGMWTKHIISILDMVDDIEKRYKDNKDHEIKEWDRFIAMVDEKIGDAINYLILLEALIKERYSK